MSQFFVLLFTEPGPRGLADPCTFYIEYSVKSPYRMQKDTLSLYYNMKSVHQDESKLDTIKEFIMNDNYNKSYVAEDEYPELPLVYDVQDKYRALYDLILNPLVDENDALGGSSDYLLGKIKRYRASCFCGTKESGSNGQMEHVCPSGKKFVIVYHITHSKDYCFAKYPPKGVA